MKVNEYLKKYPKEVGARYAAILGDGSKLSIQASKYHYCSPQNDEGPYTEIEMGFPHGERLRKEINEAFPQKDSDEVWGYVDVDELDKFLTEFGGIERQFDLEE